MAAFLSCAQLTDIGAGDPGDGGTVEAEWRTDVARFRRTRLAVFGTCECAWSARHLTNSLSLASTVSITWFRT
jgi:hypothetical protein